MINGGAEVSIMWFKRFSSRQKLVILCFLVYFVYGITKQATYTTKAPRQTADLSSIIRAETNITKLKQLNDQINAQINNMNSDDQNRHDIKPDLGVDHQHMPIPAGHAQINEMQQQQQQQQQQKSGEENLAKMENAVEKVKEEQSRRRSVAGTVIVSGYTSVLFESCRDVTSSIIQTLYFAVFSFN